MACFKTTYNILKKPWECELYDDNWLDSNKVELPWTGGDWDYSRELTIDDVDIWEVLYESGNSFGIYAAYSPNAEFYMIRVGYILEQQGYGIETYYGPEAGKSVFKRAKELKVDLPVYKEWVAPEDLWLHMPVRSEDKKIISTPTGIITSTTAITTSEIPFRDAKIILP
jgi:hypothetical protein